MKIYYDEKSNKVLKDDCIHNYNPATKTTSVDPVTTTVLSEEQVRAIEIVMKRMLKMNKGLENSHSKQDSLPTVYIVKYTANDGYGDYDNYRVFADESDAFIYCEKVKRIDGIIDVSVMPRNIY